VSSGGKKQATTTTVSSDAPPEWAVPYFKQNLDTAGRVLNQPYEAYTG
jgi:hypothetical protein